MKNFCQRIFGVNNIKTRRNWLIGIIIIGSLLIVARLVMGLLTDIGQQSKSTEFDIEDSINKRPWTIWTITQFTWLTTYLTMFCSILVLYKLNRKSSWIGNPSTIFIVAIYEFVVMFGFWGAVAIGGGLTIVGDFSKTFPILDYGITIVVHAIFPVSFIVFACAMVYHFPFKFSKKQIWLSIVYPAFYSMYYLFISLTWYDPYSVTSIYDKTYGVVYNGDKRVPDPNNLYKWKVDSSLAQGVSGFFSEAWKVILAFTIVLPLLPLFQLFIFNKLIIQKTRLGEKVQKNAK